MYFNIKNEREMKMWNHIDSKFSKSNFVKEAIEEKMLRELKGETISVVATTAQEHETVEQKKQLSDKDKKNVSKMGSL